MRSERWIPVEPADYDEPHEVEALELEPGYFISPYDVPDGIRVTYDGELFGIYLRYLTDEEESRRSKSDRADLYLMFGKHSNRLIGLEASSLPPWADVRDVLSAVRTRVNHYVAWTVLRDSWPKLLDETRKLRALRTARLPTAASWTSSSTSGCAKQPGAASPPSGDHRGDRPQHAGSAA